MTDPPVTTLALAEETTCVDPRVRIEGRPEDRWLGPIARACAALETTPDSDPTSRVRLVPAGTDLIVEVVLDDGREALRRVHEPEQLTKTLDALLTLPPSLRRTEPPAPAPPEPPIQRVAFEPLRVAAAAPAREIGFEAGLAVGGRVAGAETYLSFAPSGFAAVRVDDWLLGFVGRWDVIESTPDVHLRDFEMDTLGVGVFVARRFHAGAVTVDGGFVSRLLVETQSFRPTFRHEDVDARSDLRVGLFARASLGHASFRPFVEADGEISPARLRRDIRIGPELPVLPSWSAGVGAGAAWGK